MQDLEELSGYVERLTYYNEESCFSVAKVVCRNKKKEVVVVGSMPQVQVGTTIHCTGNWTFHPKHGKQFEVQQFRLEIPYDAPSIKKFLGSGTVKGLGPAYAEKIVKHFGDATIEILETAPERLFEVPNIGEKRVRKIIDGWVEHKTLQELFLFLHAYGISRTYARKILRTYGNFAVQKIQQNPYQLAKDVPGIGFSKADDIAKQVGLAENSP
jgi:exodeoxyribonuclease V alpha subunit